MFTHVFDDSMEYPFITYGWIRYNPERGRMKERTDWWCVLELDDNEISRYYRWFIDRQWWDADSSNTKRAYHRPTHQSHISLVRGERPKQNIDDWGKYMADKKVFFRYGNNIRQTSNAFHASEPDKFWFIDTDWKPYVDFRKHFGLPYNYNGTPFRGHLTISRTY
jgi:hypothetical protein